MVFEVWLRSELPALLRFTDALCGGRQLGEEIMQDVAVKAHRRWSHIGPLPHRNAYVRRMIINEYLSWRRKWSRLVPHADLADRSRAGGADIADEQADRAVLVAELSRLPRKQRTVLVLRYVEGQAMRGAWPVVPALLLAAVAGCTGPVEPPPVVDPTPEVAARTSWVLSHRVTESSDLRITGGNMGHYDEATYLSLGLNTNGLDIPCYVTVSAPGQGGPKTMVGEKVETTVNGSPGFRNGAGAEGPYLMWRYRRGAWAMVHCSGDEGAPFLETIADAVSFKRSPMRLPWGLPPLPAGYGLSSVSSDLNQGSHSVYLGKVVAAFGHAEPDIVVSYQTGARKVDQPGGRPITVNRRDAFLNEDREGPGVCVAEQQRYVCVSAFVSDTGPYPDRTDEIPILLRLAEGLRFAADLDDRSTWLESDDALSP